MSTSTKHVAVSNQKGGVGKTMIAINLAGALNQRGHTVLFVDVDPQGNATEGLGLSEVYEEPEPNLRSVLVSQDTALSEIIETHPEMDLVPSNIDLFKGEAELVTEMQGRKRLQRAVADVDGGYDFVIYDCPPSLLVLTDSALLAAQNVLIPALAESTSTRALDILFDQIDTLEAEYETSINEQAIVANRVEPDGEAEEMMTWFQETFEPGLPIFEIRKRVVLKRAWSNGVSVFEHTEDCDMEAEFDQLAAHLEDAL
ncbi:ParA family protein [Halobellus rufus]|uniref:ParA family protein n=1 Tax=Halobellus rufus TaxID=1448860 RepID=UPI00067843B1|nr:ParA family protein [Halobellus rufus]